MVPQGYKFFGVQTVQMGYGSLVKYLVTKILGKIQGTEMLVDLENLGTR